MARLGLSSILGVDLGHALQAKLGVYSFFYFFLASRLVLRGGRHTPSMRVWGGGLLFGKAALFMHIDLHTANFGLRPFVLDVTAV